MEYVIISGDVSENGAEYTYYKTATEKSDYTGLIFNTAGNHEQATAGREAILNSAIYDGADKKWISLKEAGIYFRKRL